MFRTMSAPINIQLELTSRCNHNCIHCYNYWRQGPEHHKETVLDSGTLDFVEREVLNSHIFHITLTGGEPLLVVLKAYDVLKRLRDSGVTFSINTNLTLLDSEIVELLKNLGINSVLTSLTSADQEINDAIVQNKGSFKRTVSGITLAVRSGIRVTVNMVVTRGNFHTILDTGRLAKELGASTFCATKASAPQNCPDFSEFAIDSQQLSEMFRVLLLVKRECKIGVDSLEHYPACIFPDEETRIVFGSRSCTAGKTSCTIGFNGEVRPCSHAPMSYGNVRDGMRYCWLNMSHWRSGELIPSQCRSICGETLQKCGGGCRVEAHRSSGKLNGLDPYCIGKRPFVRRIRENDYVDDYTGDWFVLADIRFRSEDFGGIAFRSPKNWLPVGHELFRLLSESYTEGKSVTITDIASAHHVPNEKALPTFAVLARKKILTQNRRR